MSARLARYLAAVANANAHRLLEEEKADLTVREYERRKSELSPDWLHKDAYGSIEVRQLEVQNRRFSNQSSTRGMLHDMWLSKRQIQWYLSDKIFKRAVRRLGWRDRIEKEGAVWIRFTQAMEERIHAWMRKRGLWYGRWDAFYSKDYAALSSVSRKPGSWEFHTREYAEEHCPELFRLRVVPAADRPCALYRWFDKQGALLYVGISVSLLARVCQHRASPWHEWAATMTVETYESESEARAAELRAIRDENPKWNRAGKLAEAA